METKEISWIDVRGIFLALSACEQMAFFTYLLALRESGDIPLRPAAFPGGGFRTDA